MLDLNKYNQVIFDCDGVILDSNKVKSEAFATALMGEDQKLIDEFLHYHKENGGISRFVKFEYFFEVMKKQINYKNDLKRVLRRYSELSLKGLLACKEIRGVRETLKQLNQLNIDCFVVSGGEQGEVRSVLLERKFSPYFQDIYGSPVSKQEHLEKISPNNALYFGDAKSDYTAANSFGIDFAYISGASEWENGYNFCRKNHVLIFDNFEDLI
jgi:phosphoglycolate phosphatase-like HAD superfamily hydrolase